jgi:acyl dehydratase
VTSEADIQQRRYGRITEEALAELRARMGKQYPITQPFNREVTRDAILHYARAVGDTNPLWLDEEYARSTPWGGIIAPPCFLYSVHWGSWDMRRGDGLPGVHGLHFRDRWEFFRPLRLGDRADAVKELVGLEEKESNFAGRAVIQTRRIIFRNQGGELVATCDMSSYRTERDAARQRGKYKDISPARYSRDDLARIEADYDAEVIRGATPRYWEDVEVGEELTPVVFGPLTSADCIAWVMGVGSPHIRAGRYWLDYRRRTPNVAVVNPETGVPEPVERVHWDNWMAREAGLPYAYDYGSHRGAISSRVLTNWMGDTGFLKVHDVVYRGFVFLGDTVWYKGTVTGKFLDGPNQFVLCELQGVNQRQQTVLVGHAIVALPSRERGPVVFPVELSQAPEGGS